MEFIKKNKSSLIFALIIIILAIIFYILFNKSNSFKYTPGKDYLRNYGINEVIPIYVTEEDIAKKYLTEYVNLMLYYPDKAYELLSDNIKDKEFKSLKDFKDYINRIFSAEFAKADVKEYAYKVVDNSKCLFVKDASGNTFKFIEESLMNYTVEIN